MSLSFPPFCWMSSAKASARLGASLKLRIPCSVRFTRLTKVGMNSPSAAPQPDCTRLGSCLAIQGAGRARGPCRPGLVPTGSSVRQERSPLLDVAHLAELVEADPERLDRLLGHRVDVDLRALRRLVGIVNPGESLDPAGHRLRVQALHVPTGAF